MSKKHYAAIAAILRDRTAGMDHEDYVRLVDTFASYFAEGNVRFDRARFIAACGL